MEVTPEFAALVGLVGYGRTYCGLSYDEAEAIGLKAIELSTTKASPSDLVEAFDLVWGATLSAGLVNPGDWNVPVQPLSVEEQIRASRLSDSFTVYHSQERKRPKEYDDSKFIADVPKKKKRKAI